MSATEDVLKAVASGPDAFAQWASDNSDLITKGLAWDLREEAVDSLNRGDGIGAVLRQMGASQILRVVGEARESLLVACEAHETFYMMANTPAEYDNVRERLLEAEHEGRDLGAFDLSFRMAVVAADCCYWASHAAPDADDKANRLMQCFEDLLRAADGASDIPEIYLMRYSSLAIAAFISVTELDPPLGDDQLDPLLVSLARDTERLVPVDFVVTDDVDKTKYTARHLARLSNEYGNPQIGSKRRAFEHRYAPGG